MSLDFSNGLWIHYKYIYGNKEIWKLFGYEGSSVEHGGYVKRGFDINWIQKAN